MGSFDEFRLIMYPVILGSGKRLFRDEMDTSHLRLTGTRAFASGAVLLTYEPVREAPTSEYMEAFSFTQEQLESMQAALNTDRVLASVLFTDIVDSTGRAAELGDRRWRQLAHRPARHSREGYREAVPRAGS